MEIAKMMRRPAKEEIDGLKYWDAAYCARQWR
jgi:hypothetical protein